MADTEMTVDQLQAIVGQKLTSALGYQGGMLSQERLKAEQYYKGEPFGDEVEGQSSVVSRDVAESIDSMLPSLLKIFGSTANLGVFNARRPAGEAGAKQATDYVNYMFNKRNQGFLILHNWFKDALLKKLGIVKSWWNDETTTRKETYQGLSDLELQMIQADPDVEIVKLTSTAQTDMSGVANPAMQMMNPPQTHDVILKRTKKYGCVSIANVPPEEFLCDHRSVSTDETPFLAHRSKQTVSKLIEMGFDREFVEGLASTGAQDFGVEVIERFKDEDAYPYRSDNFADLSMREIWLAECYLWVDFDGDGIAELRQIFIAGEEGYKILQNADGSMANIEVDDHPFSTLTPVPMPHKLYGLSVADQTSDIQQIKSALLRGLLNSIYLQNAPRIGIVDGQVNLDDLLDVRSGAVIRMKSPNALLPIETVPVSDSAFKMVQYQDTVRETRTGVRRFASALSADSINPYSNTATGVKDVAEASDDRLQLIARIFAETGITHLFTRIFELTQKHQQHAEIIRLRGQYVEMDPREWDDEMDLTVSVGLGTGDRSNQLTHLMGIGQIYQQMIPMQGGVQGPLVTTQNLYNWACKVVEAGGQQNVELFFTDPSTQPPQQQQQQPDPNMVKVQAQAAAAQQKQQMDAAIQQQRTQSDIAINNAKLAGQQQLDQQRQAHEMELDRQRASEEAVLERMKAAGRLQSEQLEIQERAKAGAYN